MSKMLWRSVLLRCRNFPVKTFRKSVTNLISTKAYINGQWVEAEDCKKFEVRNPADGELIALVPDMDEPDAESAICAARAAFHNSLLSGHDVNFRYMMLRTWTRLIRSHANRLSQLITMETGKPLLQSRGEVEYSMSALDAYARDLIFLNKDVVVGDSTFGVFVIKQPIGVASLLLSWDFPMALFARKAGAAIACGCTVVCKPSMNAPLVVLALCKLAEKAGFPPGVINVVTTTRQSKVGAVFCKSPDVAVVTSAGSSKVCRKLYEKYGNTLKRFNLEMYTEAAFVVFESASVNMAVDGALRSSFLRSGYMNISTSRFFVHQAVYYQFIDRLKRRLEKLRLGNGLTPETTIGPIINEGHLSQMKTMIKDAEEKNGRVVLGGDSRPEIGNLFFSPTIVIDVTRDMDLFKKEVKGPIASIIKFCSEDELCIHTKSGIQPPAAIFYGHDHEQVFRVASKMDVTLIGVNENVISAADVPFIGGMKFNDRLVLGLSEFLVKKFISFGKLKLRTRRRRKKIKGAIDSLSVKKLNKL